MVFPMVWMVLLSLKGVPEQFSSISSIISSPSSLSNYTDALKEGNFALYLVNSGIVAVVVTALNVLFCTMVAYALSRKEFAGKKVLMISVLSVLIIPSHVIMIPLFRLIVELGWINTFAALIIPWSVTPFGIYLVKQYIDQLPLAIEQAAEIDGAGKWRIFFSIVFPLCRPILIVLAVYTFLANWNSFLFPFLFTSDEAHRTLPVGLNFYLGNQSVDWGRLMAGASISAMPVLLLFFLFQKQIIKGLTAGAVKG
ncbi:MAG: carbohydrate ABC transporter permease [Candidatus Kapaibacteriales bacterium]